MRFYVRSARAEEAADISQLIIAALRETNAKDYSQEVIQRVEQSFSPAVVLELMASRTVFVAISGQAQ